MKNLSPKRNGITFTPKTGVQKLLPRNLFKEGCYLDWPVGGERKLGLEEFVYSLKWGGGGS